MSVLLLSRTAGAADKAACVAAAEDGQHLKAAGKLVEARKQFLICARADCPAAVSQDCVKWLGETDSGIGIVTIKPADSEGKPLEGAKVLVDGVVISERALPPPLELDAGHHVVRCEHAGFVTSELGLDVTAGERRQLEVKMTAPTTEVPVETPPPKKSGWSIPIPTYILAGVGVVGFAGFTVFGVMGLTDQNHLKKTCAPNCTSDQVSPVSTKFAVADVSLVVGITALTAAVVVAILWPRRSPATAMLTGPLLVW